MSEDSFDWEELPLWLAGLLNWIDAWLERWNSDRVANFIYWSILTTIALLSLVGCGLLLWGMDWLTRMVQP